MNEPALHATQRIATWEELSPTVHWAQRHQRSPKFDWRRRTYDFELLYVVQGELRVYSGQADTSISVTAGHLLLQPPGMMHEIEIITDPYVQLLGLHYDFFGELKVKADEDIIVNELRPPEHPFCKMPVLNGEPLFTFELLSPPPVVVALMEAIIDEWNERKTGFEYACRGLLLHLFAKLVRLQSRSTRTVHPKYEQLLVELANKLETGYRMKWTNADMAKYLNVHEDYMGKLFKDMMGVGPLKYLNAVRHREAKRLLRETDEKIETVAREAGFDDLHYFSRVFREREGMTASQYRRFSQL
ncbi:helix-turn-helix transcriptional regulator [Paenibacillus sp. FSL H8-0034]|uniref:helix-turn-helix transcriptional regulator n=1 Tax=Paenibacillus sp. FSL H8-0034 TaxID=2954671 RepID=UPI0030F5261E